MLTQFLEMMAKVRGATRSTISSYDADLRNFYEFLRDKPIEHVTFQDVQGYLLTQKHFASSTVARRLSSLRQFYTFLLTTGKIKENPLSLVKATHHKPVPLLDKENMERLLEGAKTWEGPGGKRLTALVQIFYETELPVKDIVSLPLKPFLDENGYSSTSQCHSRNPQTIALLQSVIMDPRLGGDDNLRQKKSPLSNLKGYSFGQVKNLPVPPLEALQEYLKVRNYFLAHGKESPWLFPSSSQKGHLTRQRFGQLMKGLVAKVGLEPENISLTLIRCKFHNINQL